jgi:hypothetical protein
MAAEMAHGHTGIAAGQTAVNGHTDFPRISGQTARGGVQKGYGLGYVPLDADPVAAETAQAVQGRAVSRVGGGTEATHASFGVPDNAKTLQIAQAEAVVSAAVSLRGGAAEQINGQLGTALGSLAR